MPRTLLIIDDNKSVRDSLRFLFERRGYHVLAADGGPEGLQMARDHPVAGAMIDVNMPGMNGVEVCRALKTQAAEMGRPISIWLMTGARTNDLIKAATEAGALMVFSKPFDFPDLFRRFEEALGPVEQPKPAPDPLDQL